MTEAERAYQAAEAAIARAKGAERLSLDATEFRALDRIPPRIAELTGLQTLTLNNTRITNLAPLAELTGLQTLTLNNTPITDITPLAGMTGLRTLSLDNTQITNLAPLSGMTGLRTLSLDNTSITDFAPLAQMNWLQTLWLNNTQITDLAPLAGMTGLQKLYLNNTPITDFAPLAGMNWLQTLKLDNTQISDLALLAGMTGLQTLLLDNTQISDFALLAGMTGLQSLWLNNTRITDLALLTGMTGLQKLSLNNTQITDFAPLAGMTGLHTLLLDNTRITDLAPLTGLMGLQSLSLNDTRITDFAPLARMAGLLDLWLNDTQITDLAPLAGMTGLRFLSLNNTQITDFAPLVEMTGLQFLSLNNTRITDLGQLAGMTQLMTLVLNGSRVADIRPLAKLEKLGTESWSVLSFDDTPATKRDKRLAELAQIEDHKERTRETLAYLRTLPPWPEPYTPAATPDGSPLQPIGDTTLAQAKALSELTPLAEEVVQNPDTGKFSTRPKAIEKPDLLGATLGQVADAIEDVLHDARNGLNANSLDIRKLRRTIERYSNDPQRVEMDFTTAHGSITRLIAVEELPASDENLALLRALEEGAMGIRATDPAVAVNRRILQEQRLREMPAQDLAKIEKAAPLLVAMTEGVMQEQMQEDVPALVQALTDTRPRLPGVTRADAIVPVRDEAVRVLGRASRMTIALRKSSDMLRKLHESTAFKASEIMMRLNDLIQLGLSFF